jgi:5-methylcytosine-specific restriction endonuclease McrA
VSNRQKIVHGRRKPGPEDKQRGALKRCHCGNWFSLPACHADRHNSCSQACAKVARDRRREERESRLRRDCAVCGSSFVPRQWQVDVGNGAFCSRECASKDVASRESYKAAQPKRVAARRKSLAEGKFKILSGPENPQWKGGQKATTRRQIESGKAKLYSKRYRAANPHKVKEWGQRRRQGYLARLPRGTVPSIYERQQGRCAYCRASLNGKYHLDHIKPIARGGKHEPGNLQVLCPHCNVTKSAKCPIKYAQERGLLL